MSAGPGCSEHLFVALKAALGNINDEAAKALCQSITSEILDKAAVVVANEGGRINTELKNIRTGVDTAWLINCGALCFIMHAGFAMVSVAWRLLHGSRSLCVTACMLACIHACMRGCCLLAHVMPSMLSTIMATNSMASKAALMGNKSLLIAHTSTIVHLHVCTLHTNSPSLHSLLSALHNAITAGHAMEVCNMPT